MSSAGAPLPPDEFVEALKREGKKRYHHLHPFNLRMHEGRLSQGEIQRWVYNRYYYQTRIPIKDALIVAKSEDASFRRSWLRRIVDHDGASDGEGGLVLWRVLAETVGLDPKEMARCQNVLPDVRRACDSYVEFVRGSSLLEAVASSLTEAFAKDIMVERILAWEKHYSWIDPRGLDYFRSRVPKTRRDSEEALAFVAERARSVEAQNAAIRALVFKTEVLWKMLDAIDAERG